ncbi:MAG: prefoldin subunit alpha [Nanoarchaeota archaeon]|nr:prefoldin subunit alpha [Nanoarchaeota archaeon]
MNSQEDQQRAMMEMQMLQQEVQKVEQEIVELEKRKIELEMVLSSLDEIKNQKGDGTLIPIGSGVFVKGKLTQKGKVLINIGADVVIEKTVVEAKKIIQKQSEGITGLQQKLESDLREFVNNVQQNTSRS